MAKLSHVDEKGAARMVDVSEKAVTKREATAESVVSLSAEAFAAVIEGTAPKGDVLAAARIAGIMAAKRVPDLIPLCHPLAITGADIAFSPDAARNSITIRATVKTTGQTGVEMEALTAASIAALTLYDMIKAVDKEAVIERTRLLSKSGGKSGDFKPRSEPMRKSAGMHAASEIKTASRTVRAKPSVIMGEVIGPRAASDPTRDAFRAFMTKKRLRATEWAKAAGVPVGEILAFLTGSSRGFSSETAIKLARAAKVTPDELFR